MRHLIILPLLLVTLLARGQVDATYNIAQLSNARVQKALEAAQNKVLEDINKQHKGLNNDMRKIYHLNDTINKYLDSIRAPIVVAANTIGVYREISDMVGNLRAMSDIIAASPTNAFAVALSQNKSKLYYRVIMKSVGILNAIRQACIPKAYGSAKMTQRDRQKMLFSVRPKIRELNDDLNSLVFFLKYTTVTDVWLEIQGRAYLHAADRRTTAEFALKRWKNKLKTVKVR